MNTPVYDIIIIGGGPAGLTAAIYASRSKLSTLVIEKMGCGGQTVITDLIENYPGFPEGTSGFELAAKLEQQAKRFGAVIITDTVTALLMGPGKEKIVKTENAKYAALAVIIASGANHKQLQVPGEEEFIGKGVSYCATCDGPFFKEKEVVVVGGGDSAVQEALYLTRFAKRVTLIHRRDRLRATKILQDRAAGNPKITIILNTVITRIEGKEVVEKIILKNVTEGIEKALSVNGVFVFVGYVPNTEFLTDTLTLDQSRYIPTNDDMQTSQKGIFACGDVRKKLLKQVITAAGDGATAAFAAQEYVAELKGTAYTF